MINLSFLTTSYLIFKNKVLVTKGSVTKGLVTEGSVTKGFDERFGDEKFSDETFGHHRRVPEVSVKLRDEIWSHKLYLLCVLSLFIFKKIFNFLD